MKEYWAMGCTTMSKFKFDAYREFGVCWKVIVQASWMSSQWSTWWLMFWGNTLLAVSREIEWGRFLDLLHFVDLFYCASNQYILVGLKDEYGGIWDWSFFPASLASAGQCISIQQGSICWCYSQWGDGDLWQSAGFVNSDVRESDERRRDWEHVSGMLVFQFLNYFNLCIRQKKVWKFLKMVCSLHCYCDGYEKGRWGVGGKHHWDWIQCTVELHSLSVSLHRITEEAGNT